MNVLPDSHTKLSIRLNMDIAPQGIELLTPGASMRWEECSFDLNPPLGGRADFYVVLANARPLDRCLVPKGNNLFIAGEPLEKKIYPRRFYAQFSHLVDTHELSGHPDIHLGAPCLNWNVGLDLHSRIYRYGYDYLAGLACPPKENKIAVICSNASGTPGQRRRLALLEHIKATLGNRIVHFGRGFTPVNDKMEAILPYRYHLVLENCQSPHYWTEKLADAYLGWAYPLYLGCPNISEYFPEHALTPINSEDFAETSRKLLDLLESPLNPTQQNALAVARDLILNRYNPFAWSAHWARTLYRPAPEEMITIQSHKAFRPFPRGELYRLRRMVTKLSCT